MCPVHIQSATQSRSEGGPKVVQQGHCHCRRVRADAGHCILELMQLLLIVAHTEALRVGHGALPQNTYPVQRVGLAPSL